MIYNFFIYLRIFNIKLWGGGAMEGQNEMLGDNSHLSTLTPV